MEKLTKIKSRLLQFAKNQGLKKEDFYAKIGIDGANFRGKNALSDLGSEKIVSILTIFPELNPDWLLLEKGEMLRKNNSKNVNVTSSPQSNVTNGDMKIEAPAQLLDIVQQQQATISRQSELIERLLNEKIQNFDK